MAFLAAASPAFRSAIALNAAPRNNEGSRVSAVCPRRGSSVAVRATPMPGLPTSGLKDLGNCVKAAQFDQAMLSELFVIADAMSEVRPGSPESTMLQGYLMSTLFYEPSTRTRLSFEGAMGRLGGGILSTESAGEYSSAAKGETLERHGLAGMDFAEAGGAVPIRVAGVGVVAVATVSGLPQVEDHKLVVRAIRTLMAG